MTTLIAFFRRFPPLADIAFTLAAIMLIAEGVAVFLASNGNAVAATTIAKLLMVLTAVPFVLGGVAVARRNHRLWAIAAMIVSVIANPFLLLHVLSFFESL